MASSSSLNGWSWLFGILISIGFVKYNENYRKRQEEQKLKSQVQVGLLRLRCPVAFEDTLINDVMLEETIKDISSRLTIYVPYLTDCPYEAYMQYVMQLFNHVYDIACLHKKDNVELSIVPDLPSNGFTTWKSLVLEKDLQAVFSEISQYDEQLHNERLKLQQMRALTYHPLSLLVERRLNASFRYFDDPNFDRQTYDKVVLGGTFDHLHNGHKKLLFAAASICQECLVIGITAQEMLRSKEYSYLIDSIEKRRQKVQAYMASIRPDLKLHIETIHDPFGPSIVLDNIGAIVVSTETTTGALKINDIRRKKHMNPCDIYVIRRTNSTTLSSTYLRRKEAFATHWL